MLPGAGVVVHGIKCAPELNGLSGKLQSFDATSGRWAVELNNRGATVRKAIKPKNLRVTQPSANPAGVSWAFDDISH